MDLGYIFLRYPVCRRVLVLHTPDACWPILGSLVCVIVDFGVQEGTDITKLIPHLSPEGQDLLQKLLMYNPEDRISAKQALRHAFFREIRSAKPHVIISGCLPITTPPDTCQHLLNSEFILFGADAAHADRLVCILYHIRLPVEHITVTAVVHCNPT